MNKTGKCSLCKGNYDKWGHNPEPLKTFDERCCTECNSKKVIPARLKKFGIKNLFQNENKGNFA